jgi:hypothetical protein
MPINTSSWDRITIKEQLGDFIADDCYFDLSAHQIYTTVFTFIVSWAYYVGRSGNTPRSHPRVICTEFSAHLMSDMIDIGEYLHRTGSPEAPEHAYAIAQARTEIVGDGNPHSFNLFMDPYGIIRIADPDLARREGYIHLIQPVSSLTKKIKSVWVH